MKTRARRVTIGVMIFLFCMVLGFQTVVFAYSVNVSGGFSNYPYEFRVHTSFSSSEGTSLSSAAKAWESAGKGVLAKKSSYSNAMTSYPVNDSYNNVTRLSTTQDYLAECSWWTSNSKITEADINFNPSYTWSTNPSSSSSSFDIQTIMTHELGHALGLGHSSNTSAVMKPTFSGGERVRSINTDDTDGIGAIY